MLVGSLCTSRSFLGRQKDRMLIRQPLMPMLVVDPGKPIPFDGLRCYAHRRGDESLPEPAPSRVPSNTIYRPTRDGHE